jgi:hypothetical protein
MAKKVTNAEYRRMMSARQERIGGRFGALKPEFKAPQQPPIQTGNAPATDAAVAQQIGLLQALIRQRKSMGMETSELENYVIGTADKQGVRSVVERFISENRQKFDQDDPAGAAAYQLMKEAVVLSEGSLKASMEDAKMIYSRLRFIRELAKKTEGEQSDIATKLDEIIKPVEDQLKKRTSFGEFLKEKAQSFKKTLPERLAAKVPVIGGLLSGFLKDRRETLEDIEKYSGSLQETISRRGRKTSELDIDDLGGGSGRGMAARLGGTRASDIPGLDLSGAGKGVPSTLGAIHKEITKIRTMLESRFSPESDSSELKAREAELEGKGAGIVKKAIGGKDGEKKGGILSSILGTVKDFLGSTISTMLGSGVGKRVMSMAGGAARLAGSAVRGTGGLISSGVKAVGGFAAKAGSAIANTGVGKAVGSAASKAGGFFGNMFGKAKDIVGSLNPVKALSSGIKSSAGKIAKSLVSIPGLGALINTAIGALNIGYIKNDPNLSTDQKKEQIGRTLVGTLGSVLGGLGGGALGTALGPLGTIAGSIGGSYLGELVANSIADAIGPKGIYDLVESIPGVGSLISVEDTKAAEEAAKITAPASPNTTVGKMVSQYSAEQSALGAAKAEAAAGTATAAPTVNNSAVNTRVSNITNNFNDDLKIRNNEPTLKTMQFRTVQM